MSPQPFLHSLLCLGLCACARTDVFLREDIIRAPSWQAFSICHGHSCARVEELHLDQPAWERIRAVMQPAAREPGEERERIRHAIALLEQWTGNMTGTDTDIGGTWPGWNKPGQLDCIDESTNTTIYLRMLGPVNPIHTVALLPQKPPGKARGEKFGHSK